MSLKEQNSLFHFFPPLLTMLGYLFLPKLYSVPSLLKLTNMQSPSLYLTKTSTTHQHHLAFHHSLSSTHNSFPSLSFSSTFPKPCPTRVIAQAQKPHHNKSGPKQGVRVKGNKENVWSIDNELAKVASEKGKGRGMKRRGRKMVKRKMPKGGRVIVSGAMLVEVETVLQTQVPFSSIESL